MPSTFFHSLSVAKVGCIAMETGDIEFSIEDHPPPEARLWLLAIVP